MNARSLNTKADPPEGSLVRDFWAAECKTGLLLSSLNTRLNTLDKGGYLLCFESRTQDIIAALLIKNSYLEHTEEHAVDKQAALLQ